MAQKATVCKAALQLADVDRAIYADRQLTLARHPSETDERMMVRLLAFALNVPGDDGDGALEIAKGLWDPDEPELWQKDLTGRIVHWIEVGQPEERRLLKASARAERVSVYAFSHVALSWWEGRRGPRRPRRQSRRMARSRGAEPGPRLAGQAWHGAADQPAGRDRLGRRQRAVGRDPFAPPFRGARMSDAVAPDAGTVLDFWFGAPGSAEYGSARKEWFAKDDRFDAEIRTRFGAWIERALRGELESWSAAAPSALAQVLLLDQFTRNAFRATPRAFAGDARALAAASRMVGLRQDEQLATFMRGFVYLPFEHAEGLAMQDEAIRLLTRLAAVDPEQQSMLDYAWRHRAIIERFGRFPHRNEILGRQSTAEEIAFLKQPGSGF